MSKFNINPTIELANFREHLGVLFPKIVNDAKAFIGRLEASNDGNDVKHTLSGCKISAKSMLESREGHKLQLPPNAPMSILLRFGTQLSAIDEAMGTRKLSNDKLTVEATGFQSRIPSVCADWIEQQRADVKQGKTEVVPA